MIIDDTQKAAELFAQFDVPIAGYVVNRVVPRELLEQNIPAYLRNRIEMQDQHLGEIRTSRSATRCWRCVPELERDVTGLAMIEKLADIMYRRLSGGTPWQRSTTADAAGTSRDASRR